jgi:hypothetical protein
VNAPAFCSEFSVFLLQGVHGWTYANAVLAVDGWSDQLRAMSQDDFDRCCPLLLHSLAAQGRLDDAKRVVAQFKVAPERRAQVCLALIVRVHAV